VNDITAIAIDKNISFSKISSPVNPHLAWEVESLLLKVFEYGDYSFRSALVGSYSDSLVCTFFLARYHNVLVGAAGSLYSRKDPFIALVGPVCVEESYRRQGIGGRLMDHLLGHLRVQGCEATYLGVSQDNRARRCYLKRGFAEYQGIIMRKLFVAENEFENNFRHGEKIRIRRMIWADYPGVLALMGMPADFCTFDFRRHIFSSRFVEPVKFLSVFPQMVKEFERYGGFANLLVSDVNDREVVVGIVHVSRLPAKPEQHIAVMDFFVYDNFVEYTHHLVRYTIGQMEELAVERVNVWCPCCDDKKQDVLDRVGAVKIAVLPSFVKLNERISDVLVYQL
jgi:GNAT superfamily N-acetyltransferase